MNGYVAFIILLFAFCSFADAQEVKKLEGVFTLCKIPPSDTANLRLFEETAAKLRFYQNLQKKRLRKKDLSPSEKVLLYRGSGRYYSVRKSIRLALEDLYRLRLESRSTIIGMYQTWVLLSSHPRPSKEEKSFLNYTINYLNGKSAAKKTG